MLELQQVAEGAGEGPVVVAADFGEVHELKHFEVTQRTTCGTTTARFGKFGCGVGATHTCAATLMQLDWQRLHPQRQRRPLLASRQGSQVRILPGDEGGDVTEGDKHTVAFAGAQAVELCWTKRDLFPVTAWRGEPGVRSAPIAGRQPSHVGDHGHPWGCRHCHQHAACGLVKALIQRAPRVSGPEPVDSWARGDLNPHEVTLTGT
jgi:hypothetical protein